MTAKRSEELHQIILNKLDKIEDSLNKVRAEDVPSICARVAVLEEKFSNLKDDVRAESKRDARIYGGVGSALAVAVSLLLAWLKK